MAKMNFLKPSEISKKPEYLSHIQILEEKISKLVNELADHKEISHNKTNSILTLSEVYKTLQKEHNRSRLLNAALFISHSILAYIHFHK